MNLSHRNIPIAIIGGGIHGIAIAMRLIREKPNVAKHLVILDRYPHPLTAWQRKTRGQGMAFLRSPAVHHISTDPLGIVEYARSHNRERELAPPYAQPSASLFMEFCRDEIDRSQIDRLYHRFDVAKLRWDKGSGQFPFRIISQQNEGFRAACVILAIGSDDCPYIPPEFIPWRRRFPTRILHSRDFDLRILLQRRAESPSSLQSPKVVIIGGGLTAGTLAKNLVAHGLPVVLVTRWPLRTQQFDFDPLWLGPKYLRNFKNEPDWEKRYKVIRQVRGEGTVTPEIVETLTKYAAEKQNDFALHAGARVRCIDQPHPTDQLRIDTTQGSIDAVDLVILATGYRFDLRRYRFLSDLIERHNIPIRHGLPLLDDNLQLQPIENLFGSGMIAQLQLGPASGNIAGAALAYERLREKVLRGDAIAD
ncbi:MAG: FAD/NAD(P)-binding protein [Candidatus Poribacteria bacterium]|nr:FAD/NAD(P)-binding protein [Candidatus Poribacteria bacterium]